MRFLIVIPQVITAEIKYPNPSAGLSRSYGLRKARRQAEWKE